MPDELPFRVELLGMMVRQGRLETLAAAGDFLTAKAAFEAAVRRRPGEPILLCDRARIVMRAEGSSRDRGVTAQSVGLKLD